MNIFDIFTELHIERGYAVIAAEYPHFDIVSVHTDIAEALEARQFGQWVEEISPGKESESEWIMN